MNLIKLNIHSMVDLITNSSTSIYTWYDKSVDVCYDMIDAILSSIGVVDKSARDMIRVGTFHDYFYYRDILDDLDNDAMKGMTVDGFKQLLQDILLGKCKQPQWMADVEVRYTDYPTEFYIIAASPEYQHVADMIRKFIMSPESNTVYN